MHMMEPDPDDCLDSKNMFEPDPDDSHIGKSTKCEPYLGLHEISLGLKSYGEPDPDDSGLDGFAFRNGIGAEPYPDDSQSAETVKDNTDEEPDPDDSDPKASILLYEDAIEPDPNGFQENDVMCAEPDPDDDVDISMFTVSFGSLPMPEGFTMQTTDLPKPDKGPSAVNSMSHNSVAVGDSEVIPLEAISVLQTLIQCVRDVTNHLGQAEFRRLSESSTQRDCLLPLLAGFRTAFLWHIWLHIVRKRYSDCSQI